MNLRLVLAHLAMFTVSLIYAANFTIAKIAMPEYIQPLGFILLRAIAGSLLFWLSSLLYWEKIPLKDIAYLALCGLFGVAINQMFFFKGLELTSPINGALIMLTTPILVLVISVFALKERMSWLKILGVALGLGGAALLILSNANSLAPKSPNPLLGNIFIAINAASYGIYLILVKPITAKYHPITLMKWIFSFGFLYVLPFGWQEAEAIDWNSFTPTIWGVVIFVLLAVTYLAYLLNAAALTMVPPSMVSTYIYLQPLLASIIAVASGRDNLSSIMLIAGALIFTGVYLVSLNPKPRQIK